MTKAQRKKVEELVYSFMSALDKSGVNTEYYKKAFYKMSDAEFIRVFKKKFPLRVHHSIFKNEPNMEDIEQALKVIGVPMLEEVRMPNIFIDKDGRPVKSKECIVGYSPMRKEQQFITKKNSMSTSIEMRDMKTGLLTNYDKNGKSSDREAESMIVSGFNHTVKEFVGFKADSMNAKNIAYNTINTLGVLSEKDIPDDLEDSLALNLMNSYMIGAHLYTNIINNEYYLPHTLKNRNKNIKRM